MKIRLKVTIDQLTEVIKALQQDRVLETPVTIEDKANFYLFENAFKRLLKKQIDKSTGSRTKEFQISLPYAEAVVIYNALQQCSIIDDYRKIVVFNTSNKIHLILQSA